MKYSTLILTLLMFCITGRSQVASGQEDRAYWISVLSQVADPLLDNMSKGELRKSMPVETVSGAINPSNANSSLAGYNAYFTDVLYYRSLAGCFRTGG